MVHGLETLKRLNNEASSSSDLSACSGADARNSGLVSPRSSDGGWVDEAIKHARAEIGWLEATITYLESLKESRLPNPQPVAKTTQPESHDGQGHSVARTSAITRRREKE